MLGHDVNRPWESPPINFLLSWVRRKENSTANLRAWCDQVATRTSNCARGLVFSDWIAWRGLIDKWPCLRGEGKRHTRQERREWGDGLLWSATWPGDNRASRVWWWKRTVCWRGLGLPRADWIWQRSSTWLSHQHGEAQAQEEKE